MLHINSKKESSEYAEIAACHKASTNRLSLKIGNKVECGSKNGGMWPWKPSSNNPETKTTFNETRLLISRLRQLSKARRDDPTKDEENH